MRVFSTRARPRLGPWARRLLMLSLMLLLLKPTGDALAQQRGTFEFMPTVGAAFFLNEVIDPVTVEGFEVRSAFDDAFAVGFSLGLNFTETIGFDAGFLYVPTELSSATGGVSAGLDANEYIVGGTLRLALPWISSRSFSSYAAAGAGVKGYDGVIGTHTNAMWSVGLGTYVPLSGAFHLRFDLRDYMSRFGADGDTRFQNDVLFTAGIVFSP